MKSCRHAPDDADRELKHSKTAPTAVGGLRSWVAIRCVLRCLRARIDIGARAFCLLAGFTLATLSNTAVQSSGTLVMLIVIASVMTWWAIIDGPMTRIYLYGLVAEAAFALALVVMVAPTSDAYIIYVTAPPLLAGLRSGIFGASGVVAAQTVTLLAIQAQSGDSLSERFHLAGPWLMTGFAAGLLGAWIRQLRLVERDTAISPYASAHRLLGQLRTITRELPGRTRHRRGLRGRAVQQHGDARWRPRRPAAAQRERQPSRDRDPWRPRSDRHLG